ncbi:MAG TPA: hypothetical protein PKX38_05570 [Alphaproteobacteria bacterium]|jgi:hypothetical protein|nr:hypothetical protein [Micavibrio sp.]MBK9563394.1 hypothetical protein [Micavibrio sp.]HQX27391.1 hypothetical protein [Alphaproteobacteria bacterium]
MSHSSAPVWEKDRYIDFLGDPIGSDGKHISGVSSVISPSVLHPVGAMGVLGTFHTLVFEENPHGVDAAMYFVIGAGWAFVKKLRNSDCLEQIFDEAAKNKCIDTKPDEHTISTLDKYGLKAEEAASLYRLGIFLHSFLFSFGLVAPNSYQARAISVIGAGGIANDVRGYRRFNKIAKGEWVIVDMPEPLKVKEKVPVMSGQPVLAPIPIRY